MAVNGTHDTGEEWKQKVLYRQDLIAARDTSISVGLYNDATDALSESNDVGDITTEPTTGNYAQQTLTLDSTDVSLSVNGSGDLKAEGTVTFDVTDTGETVDGFYVVVTFQSDVVNAESAENDHLLISATFGTTDLSNYTSIDVNVEDTLS